MLYSDAMEAIPEFGAKRENEERRDGGCAVVYDPETGMYAIGHRPTDGLFLLFSGGVEKGEDVETGVLREVQEESGLHDFVHVEKIAEAITHYRNRAKQVNRYAHATCFLAVLRTRDLVETHLEAHETFSLAWKSADEILANWNADNAEHGLDHWLYFFEKARARLAELGYSTALSA